MLTPDPQLAQCDAAGVRRAVSALHSGYLVGLPTETVYGLAADARNLNAVARIFKVKGRPADHPLIVHLADATHVDAWASDVPAYARALARVLWPGPVTLVLNARADTPRLLTGGQDTIGLRVPAHPAAREIISEVGAVAAPSANRFGRVSPTRASDVIAELGSSLTAHDVVLDGGECSIGIESTIVDCTKSHPVVLRPGFYSDEVVQRAAGVHLVQDLAPASHPTQTRDDAPTLHLRDMAAGNQPSAEVDVSAYANHLQRDQALGADASTSSRLVSPRVSGSLAGHYAPATRVTIIDAANLDALSRERLAQALVFTIGSTPVTAPVAELVQATDDVDYARLLYATLRRADELGVAEIIAIPPAPTGIGIAVLDRLTRAAYGSHHS